MTHEMRQHVLYFTIPADVFWQFWKNNAVTNGGQDPGLPGPTIPYKDRMGTHVIPNEKEVTTIVCNDLPAIRLG